MRSIDALSQCSFPVELFFENTYLAHGTGFLWRTEKRLSLVTNWHVVTGRSATTLEHLSKTLAEPSRAVVKFWNTAGAERVLHLPLYDKENRPTWKIHPTLGRGADIVALPVRLPWKHITGRAINDLPQAPLRTMVGSPLFILGYPFEPERYPVWKLATVASEPALTPALRPYLLVDSASRPGMSGAPVIQRGFGLVHIEDESGWKLDTLNAPMTRFVGIYSGRLHTKSPIDAQLGMVWPAELVEEVATKGISDAHPHVQANPGTR